MDAEKDNGFTLVEILVVMIIIGILAAIAIPVYLHQRGGAYEASMRSDLHSVATLMESYNADYSAYPTPASSAALISLLSPDLSLSPGNTVTVVSAFTSAAGFCLDAHNANANVQDIYWQSNRGGLLALGVTCS